LKKGLTLKETSGGNSPNSPIQTGFGGVYEKKKSIYGGKKPSPSNSPYS